jgi:aminoglycoside phosphotransferase (APT) family kinase protein
VYLTAGTLVPYLLQKGVLSHSDLVRNNWCVLHGDRTRPVLRVATDAGRGWIVKQPSPLDRDHVAMLDREAALFQLAGEVPWAHPLKALMPRFRLYDAGVHALLVELLPFDTGLDYLRRETARADKFGRLLGRALAAIHVPVSKRNVTAGMLPEGLPWILQINATDLKEMEQPFPRKMVELIRGDPDLITAIVALKERWQNETLIHGDAKLDNVLVRMGKRPRVWLVDWAFSGIGDPAWDVGTALHSCLIIWLHGVHFSREQPFEEALKGGILPLSTVRAFLAALISGYEHARRLRDSAARIFFRRAFQFAGAALVQTAVASARAQEQVTPRHLAVIQAGSNMLNDPEDTLREFRRGG